jgi:hypothetical protein
VVIWTQVDRDDILDVIRADLTAGEELEIAGMGDEEFAGFVGRFWEDVRVQFEEA